MSACVIVLARTRPANWGIGKHRTLAAPMLGRCPSAQSLASSSASVSSSEVSVVSVRPGARAKHAKGTREKGTSSPEQVRDSI